MSEKLERKILFLTILLVLFGLVALSSAGAVYAYTRFDDQYYFVKNQLIGAGVGFALLFLLRRIDYHFWKKVNVPMFLAALLFLVLIFVPGVGFSVYGATRWIQLGPISFQPSELVKLALAVYLAAFFAAKNRWQITDFYEGLVPFVSVVALVSFLIIKQPDVGTLGVIVFIAGSIFFLAGARLSHLLLLLGGALIALAALIWAAPYRLARLSVFLNPDIDPQGIGYQVNQALIAVGAGGPWGRGLGYGLQKFSYLPEPVGDTIFAVIAEELGFIGSVLLLTAFAAFVFYAYRVAMNAPDVFGRLLAAGIASWIGIQAVINIAANVSLMPLTGIPLPFVSFGSTSLVITLAAVGILLNIAQQRRSHRP